MSLLLLSLLSPTRLTKVRQLEHDDDDNFSTVSNDKSICPKRTEGVAVDNDSDIDGNEDLTEDKRAKKSALALKKWEISVERHWTLMPSLTSLLLESYYCRSISCSHIKKLCVSKQESVI